MEYVFIEKYQSEFSIKAIVARSGWYAWRLRRYQVSPRQQFRLNCDNAVRKAFSAAKQRYGAPRLAVELPEYNVKTIAASLHRQGLRAKASRKFSPVSYRAHGLPVSENLLKQDFIASGPNQKWAGDITYLRTDEGLALPCGRYRPVVPVSYRLVDVLADDVTVGLRCVTDGDVASEAAGTGYCSYRQRRSVLFSGLPDFTETA
ncbi:hypothetical protein SAMN02982996_03171 [Lonsdalea quercina]|uniref:HTH-like domain-containing protein n=1 Tax=Lonsdalea quercina TaxID=71657 RepID=A0A1H4FP49_9GAMM|nr:hypothetical protein SAMN02982996_03171 [Lonsdalea quercina]